MAGLLNIGLSTPDSMLQASYQLKLFSLKFALFNKNKTLINSIIAINIRRPGAFEKPKNIMRATTNPEKNILNLFNQILVIFIQTMGPLYILWKKQITTAL